ncbi:outer membrane beta-barrel protein [Algoriphagus zhangzhouensis]|uniref:Outer membrane protein beta-barrel domain-containing protein n=1 Tax=Algoriphagus zhangzhouensis TaxID=1073327 RepID=A0A1M7ZHJ7_9BACT|nr:outer membrane beta-barrel protein [Algoriphagus zhangzhouensis]TDY44197.1 outer membrane protein with beta-barrel domain [Algoriphagus zhangzhouensis]SHO64368.1 Outer membrane protein beta-barrel domain-containing protein [Algoriphagus zhangzhouensis]
MELSRSSWKSVFAFSLTLGLLALAPQRANSQVLMSLIFGDKLNTEKNLFGLHMNESTHHFSNYQTGKDLRSFSMGLFFSHRVNEKWMWNLEMLAKYKRGMKGLAFYDLGDEELNALFQESTADKTIKYLSVPFTMRYYRTDKLFLEFGPQISMRMKAWDVFEVKNGASKLEYKNDIKDQINKFDIGYVIGLGLMVGKDHINAVGIRHHQGFSDVIKDTSGNQHHSQWALYANLPIGRGKMKN